MLSNLSPTSIFFWIVSLLIAMTVHEYMHAYVGYKLGDITAKSEGRLSLNPLKHIDPVMTLLLPAITLLLFHVPVLAAKPVPFNPYRVRFREYGAALLAAAGPLSNLGLAFIAAIFIHTLNPFSTIYGGLVIFIQLNVILFIFNLIPIPPLDGSRILYAFAPEPVQEFMQSIEQIGIFIVFALVMLGGLSGLIVNMENSVLSLLSRV